MEGACDHVLFLELPRKLLASILQTFIGNTSVSSIFARIVSNVELLESLNSDSTTPGVIDAADMTRSTEGTGAETRVVADCAQVASNRLRLVNDLPCSSLNWVKACCSFLTEHACATQLERHRFCQVINNQ